MAVATDALTSRANLKEALGIASADTSQDDYLDNLIDRVTDWIEGQTNRNLMARHYQTSGSAHGTTSIAAEDYIYIDGSTLERGGDTLRDERGFSQLYLPQWPVNANSELTFQIAVLDDRGSTVSGGESWDTTSIVEWDDYIVDREKGIVTRINGGFSIGHRNYRIQMSAGYSTIPDDLEMLCIELSKRAFHEDGNLSSEKIGTWSRTFTQAKMEDPFIQSTLGKYKRTTLF